MHVLAIYYACVLLNTLKTESEAKYKMLRRDLSKNLNALVEQFKTDASILYGESHASACTQLNRIKIPLQKANEFQSFDIRSNSL